MNGLKNITIKLVTTVIAILITVGASNAQVRTEREEKIEGYRFEKRIVGPKHAKSTVLEIMVDSYNNYLVATFIAEQASYTYLKIYKLYTWEELVSLRLKDKRIELYNSTFDAEGNYFYANTDIYRNKFKKIDIKKNDYEEVDCNVTPNGCRKIEPRQYTTEAYTLENHYYLYKPDRFKNSILILKSKEIIDAERARTPNFLLDDEEEGKPGESQEDRIAKEEARAAAMNKKKPESESKPESKSKPIVEEKPIVFVPSGPIDFFDLQLNKKVLFDLDRYKYAKYNDYEIIIHNRLSLTFEFEKNVTKSITISDDELKTLLTTGSVAKGELRLIIPSDLIKR
ncbi:MAG: hypothetical protein RBR35_07040 [Salinivirgaceae bacterium]|nr:hypothetical protein [Salinivirgaceae bacterium]MDY0280298.1 hypothetical protein [Salinivirgaceae bacterium]